MKKFSAIVKREYLQRVRSKMFVFMTILGPVMLVAFAVLPGLLFSIKAGGKTRLAIVDLTEQRQLAQRIREAPAHQEPESGDEVSVANSLNANRQDRLEQLFDQRKR